jgi:hypothetical protein
MLSTAPLREAKQLQDVGQRLELLADQHPHIAKGVLTICGTINSTATILEIFVATKLDGSGPL